MNVSVGIEVVTGTVSYTVQYTYDDPNNLQAGATSALAFSDLTLTTLGGGASPTPATATADGFFNFPFVAVRVVNTAAGTLRVRIVQAGIG